MRWYPTMQDAWLDLSELLEAGMRIKERSGLTTEEIIDGAIRGLHCTNAEHSEYTGDYLLAHERNQNRIRRLKAEGRCVHCGKPALPGYASCERCLQRNKEYRERRKAEDGQRMEAVGT